MEYAIKDIKDWEEFYCVNTLGQVFRKTKNGKLREIAQSLSVTNNLKVNLYNPHSRKQTTIEVRLLVYKTFVNENISAKECPLVNLDGDNKNNSVDNIISVQELVKRYNEMRKELSDEYDKLKIMLKI